MKQKRLVFLLAIFLTSSFLLIENHDSFMGQDNQLSDRETDLNTYESNYRGSYTAKNYFNITNSFLIINDSDFISQATANFWNGSGTQNDPYEIVGYNITNNSFPLIEIRDTSLYFTIANNYLNGIDNSTEGIILSNASNGNILRNIIINNTYGIEISSSDNTTIIDNSIYDNWKHGIFLYNSNHTIITGNLIYNNGGNPVGDGIYGDPSNYNIIFNNIIYSNSLSGIFFNSSVFNVISFNNLSYNHLHGINLYNSSYNTISDNQVHGNGGNPVGDGIYGDPSNHNVIIRNHIFNNSLNGIYLYDSSNNSIYSNKIEENGWYGINLSINSIDNRISLNDFINNTLDYGLSNITQAKDNGVNNIFHYNYWEPHNLSDSDNDGITDNEYSLNGTASNKDQHPKSSAFPDLVTTSVVTSTISVTTSIPSITTLTIPTTTTSTTSVSGWIAIFLIPSFLTLVLLSKKRSSRKNH